MNVPVSHPSMSLTEIASITGGALLGEEGTATLSIAIDSREVTPGVIFAAFLGENTDGHRFVRSALDGGASVALVSDPEACGGARPLIVVPDVKAAMGALAHAHVARLRESGELTVIAVTGSAGKTTTKDLLAAVLPGPTIATERSLNNEIGMPITALRANPATRYLVLEMGADHEGDLTYLTNFVRPDVAIVLMVGRAHLGVFGSVEAIARAKSELVAALPAGGVAVLNADDPLVASMAEIAPGEVITFGRGRTDTQAASAERLELPTVFASDVAQQPGGNARFTLNANGQSAPVTLGIVGMHHVSNALAAAAGALSVGTPFDDVARRLAASPASPHRMAVTMRADGIRIIDDAYNANPDSMAAALRALISLGSGEMDSEHEPSQSENGRRIAVLGSMLELGESETREHAKVGELARDLQVDFVISVGEIARTIGENVQGDAALFADTPEEADRILRTLAQPGDTVLFKASNGTGLWKLAGKWAE